MDNVSVLEIPPEDFQEVNLAPKSQDEYLVSIRAAQANVLRAKAQLKVKKEMLADGIDELPEKKELNQLKADIKLAKTDLDAAIVESEDISRLQDEVEDSVAELSAAQATLSDLLVVYSAKFNSRTVMADQNRLIIMTAKLGKVEPEQLSLF